LAQVLCRADQNHREFDEVHQREHVIHREPVNPHAGVNYLAQKA
jgi:hypothetical protein